MWLRLPTQVPPTHSSRFRSRSSPALRCTNANGSSSARLDAHGSCSVRSDRSPAAFRCPGCPADVHPGLRQPPLSHDGRLTRNCRVVHPRLLGSATLLRPRLRGGRGQRRDRRANPRASRSPSAVRGHDPDRAHGGLGSQRRQDRHVRTRSLCVQLRTVACVSEGLNARVPGPDTGRRVAYWPGRLTRTRSTSHRAGPPSTGISRALLALAAEAL